MRAAWCVLLYLGIVCSAHSAEVIVEGRAPIRGNDVGQAKELATRRALARAAETQSANVTAQTILRDGAMTEMTQVRASACTENSQMLSESVNGDELTVRMQVSVREPGSCQQSCSQATVNRVVIAGFSVEHPEQILRGENSWLTNLTPLELSRWIDKRRRVLTTHDATTFPHVSPGRAPQPNLTTTDVETPFSVLARKHRGQYVVSGVYRDLGLVDKGIFGTTRRIEVEVFIHDGVNGSVLERKTFSSIARGDVLMTARPVVGSAEFYRTDLGRVWGRIMSEIADWTTEKTRCLPFVTRVLKIEGSNIYLDAGADSGVSVGDSLLLHTWRQPVTPVRANGVVLGQEKYSRATATIRYRYPEFSVAEFVDVDQRIELAPGDLFYAQ